MTSDDLFAGVFSRGGASAQVSGRAWLQALLDVEAALAHATANAGLIPPDAAEAIAAACRAEAFDIAALGRDGAAGGNPVIPLVVALRAAVGPGAAPHVHHGATSQDVLDTAAMLVTQRALEAVLADADGAADACAGLAGAHAGTPMIGRTLLQQALPTTFGLKAAGWMTGIDEARGALSEATLRTPAVQLGGAAGTRAAFGAAGPAVAAALAAALGLADPVLPWHSNRVRPAALAGALALLAGALGKVALDVTLLAQNEVAEVREGGGPERGGSSAMPHKRNPVAAVSVVACAQRVPGLAATMYAAMLGEHERAAGAWHSEWETLSDLLRLTGSAAAWSRDLLEGLEVDAARMRSNLDAAIGRLDPGDRDPAFGIDAAVDAATVLVHGALAAHRER